MGYVTHAVGGTNACLLENVLFKGQPCPFKQNPWRHGPKPPKAALGAAMSRPQRSRSDEITALEQRTRAAIDALSGLEQMAQSSHPNNGGIPTCM